jgi:hypothetical protein
MRRSLRRTARYWVPLLAGTLCLVVASYTSPIVTYVLVIASFALLFDGCTAMFAKAGGTGSLRDFKQ